MTRSPCTAADGDCTRPARKAGMCWGHWKRKMRGQSTNSPLVEYSKEPIDGLRVAAVRWVDCDTSEAADVDFVDFAEAQREPLRRYLWAYVSKWIRRQGFTKSTRTEIEAVLNRRTKRRL